MRCPPLVLLLAFALTSVFAMSAAAQDDLPPPREAVMMRLGDDWTIDGGLPESAFLISLQGVVNKDDPHLYFIYPPDWAYTFTESLYEYYQRRHNITFSTLETPEGALTRFADLVDGYVVWDPEVRTSLIVAFTVAGLERAVVVTEDQIPMVEAAGLEPVEDFRGRFAGQSDAEIYQWAVDAYWDRTNKDFIVWMGGYHGARMEPGVADFGIRKSMFFTDLSADPADTLEYQLHRRLLAEMNPQSLVMGWHSYGKDTEGQHISLLSSYGHRMEGLNTLPNMSFSSQIPTTPGFTFENNHNVDPDTTLTPDPKVYLATIQTDALGIGAWLKPGRGEIPYAWEVTMNWSWLAPALMQYFYDEATPNDYFIGVLSGPGYLYPKPVPPDDLPVLIDRAEALMDTLDLRVFEIMDYSEGNRRVGNLDLPKRIVDAYYEGMPDAIGFINGYGPARTFDLRDGRPFMSYDYYLSPTRPVDVAVADLRELMRLNPERPYFLLMHVRESSDVARVKTILDRLGPEIEHVPLDVFLKLAAGNPTFQTRYLQPGDAAVPHH